MRSFLQVVETTAGAGGSTDLVTWAALQAALTLEDSAQEATEAQITRYSNAIADALDRRLALTEVVETFVFETCETWLARQPLVLSQYPVLEVFGVLVDDQTVTDYELDATKGLLYRLNGWWGPGRIEVSYQGGYLLPDQAPAALAEAVIEAVRQGRAFSSANPTLRSLQHGDVSVSYYSAPQQSSHGLPATVMASIKQFRRISF